MAGPSPPECKESARPSSHPVYGDRDIDGKPSLGARDVIASLERSARRSNPDLTHRKTGLLRRLRRLATTAHYRFFFRLRLPVRGACQTFFAAAQALALTFLQCAQRQPYGLMKALK
jgi:hypothetical protein